MRVEYKRSSFIWLYLDGDKPRGFTISQAKELVAKLEQALHLYESDS